MNAPSRPLQTRHRYRLRVDDFIILNDGGAFRDFAKSELIDGDVYVMNAQHAGHARIKSRLHVQLANCLASFDSDIEAMVEVTVRTGENGAPEPDIVLTRWRGTGVVPVDTIVLVVEVADTTLATDLGLKAALYATAGIPEYWVVDVDARRVVVHTRPEAGQYAGRAELPFGELLTSTAIAGLQVDTAVLCN